MNFFDEYKKQFENVEKDVETLNKLSSLLKDDIDEFKNLCYDQRFFNDVYPQYFISKKNNFEVAVQLLEMGLVSSSDVFAYAMFNKNTKLIKHILKTRRFSSLIMGFRHGAMDAITHMVKNDIDLLFYNMNVFKKINNHYYHYFVDHIMQTIMSPEALTKFSKRLKENTPEYYSIFFPVMVEGYVSIYFDFYQETSSVSFTDLVKFIDFNKDILSGYEFENLYSCMVCRYNDDSNNRKYIECIDMNLVVEKCDMEKLIYILDFHHGLKNIPKFFKAPIERYQIQKELSSIVINNSVNKKRKM